MPQLARELYDACTSVKPTWEQCGDVTKSVWIARAALKLAGVSDWWSIRHTLINAVSGPGTRTTPMELVNMNHKKIAEQLDIISGAFTVLSGCFRASGDGSTGGAVDGAPAKPVRAGKSAAKPAAKEADAPDIDTVREKLKELMEAKGKEKMVEALEAVGAGKLGDVDESQYQELMDKCQEFIDEEDEPAPKAKGKPAAKKAKGPSLADVTEAAKALIEADKPAYLKLTKKLGKPSDMDEGDYAAAITAYEAAMPEDDDALL